MKTIRALVAFAIASACAFAQDSDISWNHKAKGDFSVPMIGVTSAPSGSCTVKDSMLSYGNAGVSQTYVCTPTTGTACPCTWVLGSGAGGGITSASVQTGRYLYGADAGGDDAYAITLSPAPTSYDADGTCVDNELCDGTGLEIRVSTTNTGATAVVVNGLTSKAIKMPDGTDPPDGLMLTTALNRIVWNRTADYWQIASSGDISGVTCSGGVDCTGQNGPRPAFFLDTGVAQTRINDRSGADNFCKPTSGSAGVEACVTSPLFTAPELGATTAPRMTYIPFATNTGAKTIDMGTGALSIKRQNGDALQAGDVVAGVPVILTYMHSDTSWRIPGRSTMAVAQWVELLGGSCQGTSAFLGYSTPTSNAPTGVCVTGTNSTFGVASFTATGQTAQMSLTLPDDYTSVLAIEYRFISPTAGATGNVVWSQSYAVTAATAGTSIDPSWTALTAPSIVAAANNTLNTATSSAPSISGGVGGGTLWLKFGLDATTTATGIQNLKSVRIKLKRTMPLI